MCFDESLLYQCVFSILAYISNINDAEPRLSISEKKRARTDTLAKRARNKLRLLQNITESK